MELEAGDSGIRTFVSVQGSLAMFPILVWMYVRLAHKEELEAIVTFGDTYRGYAKRVPGFFPRLLNPASTSKA